jgi:hypothetical protein
MTPTTIARKASPTPEARFEVWIDGKPMMSENTGLVSRLPENAARNWERVWTNAGSEVVLIPVYG